MKTSHRETFIIHSSVETGVMIVLPLLFVKSLHFLTNSSLPTHDIYSTSKKSQTLIQSEIKSFRLSFLSGLATEPCFNILFVLKSASGKSSLNVLSINKSLSHRYLKSFRWPAVHSKHIDIFPKFLNVLTKNHIFLRL